MIVGNFTGTFEVSVDVLGSNTAISLGNQGTEPTTFGTDFPDAVTVDASVVAT